MTNDMLGEVQDIIVSGIENNSAPTLNVEVYNVIHEQNASKFIKENLEKKYGPTWQVILGIKKIIIIKKRRGLCL